MGDHSQQMQGDRLIGGGLQDLSVKDLGLGQAAGGVVLQREVQSLLDGAFGVAIGAAPRPRVLG